VGELGLQLAHRKSKEYYLKMALECGVMLYRERENKYLDPVLASQRVFRRKQWDRNDYPGEPSVLQSLPVISR